MARPMAAVLEVRNLQVAVENKEVVKGFSVQINQGEVHALMGPNGSGKSSLASAIMGHPAYKISSGQILLNGEDITSWVPEKRATAGLFLAFQYPQSIPGLSVEHFLRSAYNAQAEARGEKLMNVLGFRAYVEGELAALHLNPAFLERGVNDGFSGGEKKRLEILQLAVLKPRFAILDETDSGLDVDALKVVAEGVNRLVAQHQLGILVITHYQRLLHYLKPTHVHVMAEGSIIVSAGPELIEQVEASGYQPFIQHA